MSAFVMLEEGFAQLADELASRAEHPRRTLDTDYMIGEHVREFLSIRTPYVDAYQIASAKVQELYAANVKAVSYRYEQPDVALEPLKLTRGSVFTHWTPVELVKHLECLSYQCAEGSIPDSSIYKELDKLISQIHSDIVRGLPEWDKAAWDFKGQAVAA